MIIAVLQATRIDHRREDFRMVLITGIPLQGSFYGDHRVIVAFHIFHYIMNEWRIGYRSAIIYQQILERGILRISHGIGSLCLSPIRLTEIVRLCLHIVDTYRIDSHLTSSERRSGKTSGYIHQINTCGYTGQKDRVGDAIHILIAKIRIS